jgi:hypothetical protein
MSVVFGGHRPLLQPNEDTTDFPGGSLIYATGKISISSASNLWLNQAP